MPQTRIRKTFSPSNGRRLILHTDICSIMLGIEFVSTVGPQEEWGWVSTRHGFGTDVLTELYVFVLTALQELVLTLE